MALFQTSLVSLMHQRLQYLSKRSQVLTQNISQADIPGTMRRDLKPFRDLVRKKSLDTAKNNITSETLSLNIKDDDISTTKTEVEREMEVLELSHNSINHQALIDVLSTMHRLYRTAVARN